MTIVLIGKKIIFQARDGEKKPVKAEESAIAFAFAYAPSRALLAGGRISGSEVSGGSPGPNRGPTGGTCAFFCFFVVEATSRLSLRP